MKGWGESRTADELDEIRVNNTLEFIPAETETEADSIFPPTLPY